MNNFVVYEYPLNERMRNFMRLEHHFHQINHFFRHHSICDAQTGILCLIETLNIIDRNDIKNEVTKELERNISALTGFLDAPGINAYKLQQTLDQLKMQVQAIHDMPGKIAQSMRENELINSIRQRISVTSSIYNFDIPSFYFWLHQAAQDRLEQLQLWLSELKPIEEGITISTRLLRDSALFERHTAIAGFFQKVLNAHQTCQMVRIELPNWANYFPETSGSKHRVSIRFLEHNNHNQRPSQISSDVEFNLSCCGI